jgi:hypothetical protein
MRSLVFLIGLTVAGLLTLNGASKAAPAGEGNGPAMRLAKAYGIDQWDQIEKLQFTFNVDLPNKDQTITRQWSWWPKQNKVTWHRENQSNVTYQRQQLADAADPVLQADKHFINDHYWLLFPFQPIWSIPTVTDEGTAALPIGEGEAQKLAVRYPAEGGYTPGDGYNLYLSDDGLIQQWQYLPGGDPSQAMAHTWDKHRQLGPIVVSLEHWGPNKNFRLWFTGVEATLTDGQTVTPQPRSAAAKE